MDYEKAHIKRTLQLEPAINQLFEDFIWRIAPQLKRMKYDRRGIWSRNPLVERQVDQALREFATQYKHLLQAHMAGAWGLSEEKNDNLLLIYLKGLGIVLGAYFLLKTFNRQRPPKGTKVDLGTLVKLTRNLAARDEFLKGRLSKTISPRVWDLTAQNKTLILNCVSSGILEGRSSAKIAQELRKYLKEPNRLFRRIRDPETGKFRPSEAMKAYHPGQGVYRSSYKNALRLARNETNMAYRAADMHRWQKTEFILGYDVKLSGSHPEYDLCDEMAGRFPKDFTFIGWHPQCYCYAVPVLPRPEVLIDHLKNDTLVRGNVKSIPGRAQKYVNSKAEKILAMPATKRPYWAIDNYRVDGKTLKLNINSKTHSYAK